MTRYAVMGDPIAQSKSPQIHSQFANLTKQNVAYEKLRVEAHEFPARVNAFFNSGGGGLNVTVPHKEDAFALADTASPRAALAKAAAARTERSGSADLRPEGAAPTPPASSPCADAGEADALSA